MEMFVGYAEREPAGTDVETPAAADAAAGTAPLAEGHAVATGSPVSVCGAAIDHTLDDTWPPTSGPACPRCVAAVRGYTM